MRLEWILISLLLLAGCCTIDSSESEFSPTELEFFGEYHQGDTVYFESNLLDIDTIMILGFENEKYDDCGIGFIQRKPSNTRWIKIKHLPYDRWYGITLDMNADTPADTVRQGLISISKYPTDKITTFSVDYRGFYSYRDSIVGEFRTDTLRLNDLIFTNYYVVEHSYPERGTRLNSIQTVYWTREHGLTAYKAKNGETWTIKSS